MALVNHLLQVILQKSSAIFDELFIHIVPKSFRWKWRQLDVIVVLYSNEPVQLQEASISTVDCPPVAIDANLVKSREEKS